MSQKAEDGEQRGVAGPRSGLEALRQSSEFRGPGDSLDDHDHANDHFALLYDRSEEQLASAISFIRQGLERGEQCLYVADDNSKETVLEAMRAYDIDVDAALESGALSILTPAETYRRTGNFDRETMLEFWEDSLEEAKDEEGYTGLRAAAEMTWALEGDTGPDELVEYEAVLNSLYEDEDYVVMCQYNRERFPVEVIHDVIKTHPHLVVDNTISQNFYYTPPEKFFGSEDLESKVDRMTQTLRKHTTAKTELQDHREFLQELYEITASNSLSFEDKLQAMLNLGCERFDMELGGLAIADPETDRFEVEITNGEHENLASGKQYPLSETYCQAAVDSEETCAITAPESDEFEGKLCYDKFGVRSYLGTHLEFDDAADRTFWFVSNDSRAGGFSESKRTFHHLMGQWAQYELERQQREQELRERTEHLNALIETTPECIKTVAPDGTLLQMNSTGLDMVEADAAEDVTGECVYDLIAPEHRERFREFNERICQGESGSLEFDIVGLEGTRRHMETHAAPLERPDGTTVHVALTRDVTEQKEREVELRQTKDRFETVFEQSDDGIFIIDPEADELVDANPAAADMLGYTRDRLLSHRPSDLHPDEMEQFRAFLSEAREQGSSWNEDLHCRHKNGHDIPAEITASTITLDGRDLVLTLIRSIEERKIHERYQRDLYEITADPDLSFDEKLEGLLELGRDRFGLEMGGLNHLPSWDGKFRLEKGVGLGLDPDEELWTDPDNNCYCRQTITEKDPVAMADVRGTHWTEDTIYQEFGMVSYLGTKVSSGSVPYGTLWFGSTEPREEPFSAAERSFIELMGQWVSYEIERRGHKQSQQELYEITSDSDLSFDEKVSRLLDLGREKFGLDMGFFLKKQGDEFRVIKTRGTDLEDGVATLCANPDQYCKRTITMDVPVGVEDTEAAGWDDDPLYREYDLGCYLGTKVTDGTGVYGSVCFADSSSRNQEFSDDDFAFLDLMGQWLSYELERREREAELETTIEQLQQSNDRLKQFAYAASHDLQEPLRMVSSYLQLLENQYKDELDEDAQEYIDFAVDGADRMRAMVNDLLAFARVEQADGEFGSVDCNRVLDRVVDDLQVKIEEKDAAISVESLPTVHADGEQLEQVFCNLVSNAIKYSGEESPEVEIAVEERAGHWEFAVADNGIGIDPDKQERIFEVFKRLHHDSEHPGTGIGLSLCQEIVDNHGGDMWVDSKPGEGSTFFFTIPKQTAD